MRHVLVIGLGVSGKAAARLLLHQGFCVTAADQRANDLKDDPEVQKLLAKGLRIVLDRGSSFVTDAFSLVVVSPGIDPSHPLIQKTKGIEQIGEIELAFRFLPNQRIAGVTGSNGKTTTVLLTAHILNAAGKKAVALGNVGVPLSSYALRPDPNEILIVELSSFQLETLHLEPRFDAAAILNITPNHLNRHASMEEYAAAKLRLASCVKKEGRIFISGSIAKKFSQLQSGQIEIFDRSVEPVAKANALSGLQIGAPEWPNIRAAEALCTLFGIASSDFNQGVKTFRKPPHRIEWVDEIDGVAYYNDSKASNVDAVIHAVRLFPSSILLIAGGVDKGASYHPWINAFGCKVKKIFVFGAAAAKMEQELSSAFAMQRVGSLQEAVRAAKCFAHAGDTVLLSPGCSSYDQFKDFEHRGNAFKNFVNEEKRRWIEKRP